MSGLTSTIQKCKLQLKLDNKTEGHGNCFPNAIVQQCRRPEVKEWLKVNKQHAIVYNHQSLRDKLQNFALKSRHKTINQYKTNYEQVLHKENNKSWEEYWAAMGQDGTWVDSVFVQVTAWFMGLDILILTTSSIPEKPFITIQGNIENPSESSSGPPLLLGNYTNVHYQSLLPLSKLTNMNSQSTTSKPVTNRNVSIEVKTKQENFIFMNNKQQITFINADDGRLQCPFCKESFLRLISHVTSTKCQLSQLKINIAEFTSQLHSVREGFRLALGR